MRPTPRKATPIVSLSIIDCYWFVLTGATAAPVVFCSSCAASIFRAITPRTAKVAGKLHAKPFFRCSRIKGEQASSVLSNLLLLEMDWECLDCQSKSLYPQFVRLL